MLPGDASGKMSAVSLILYSEKQATSFWKKRKLPAQQALVGLDIIVKIHFGHSDNVICWMDVFPGSSK
jgi:hypothetical protein